MKSSLFVLTTVAVLPCVVGALASGMWNFMPPDPGIYSFGNYLDASMFANFFGGYGLNSLLDFSLDGRRCVPVLGGIGKQRQTGGVGCVLGHVSRMVF